MKRGRYVVLWLTGLHEKGNRERGGGEGGGERRDVGVRTHIDIFECI